MNYEYIAKLAHEVNRAYCAAIGDMSQYSWDDAPQWQKESAINGVKFHAENPNSKPEDSHINWMKEKIEQGWTYGPVKDPENKKHPCILDYSLLPENQKAKDYIFHAICHISLETL